MSDRDDIEEDLARVRFEISRLDSVTPVDPGRHREMLAALRKAEADLVAALEALDA
jgi:hypothetical protein